MISKLYEGYPAYRNHDLAVGDVVSTINGEKVDSLDDAYRCSQHKECSIQSKLSRLSQYVFDSAFSSYFGVSQVNEQACPGSHHARHPGPNQI